MGKVIIFDINPGIIKECKEVFNQTNLDIECRVMSFEDVTADYVVTAGNSSGIMSGGIDLAVRNDLGIQIQDRIQHEIMYKWHGNLPVGYLVEVPFNKMKIENAKAGLLIPSFVKVPDDQKLLYVPTMDIPKRIDIEDVYFVACKIFRHCKDALIYDNKSLAICGLGTATGGVSARAFALMIKRAYEDIIYASDSFRSI